MLYDNKSYTLIDAVDGVDVDAVDVKSFDRCVDDKPDPQPFCQ